MTAVDEEAPLLGKLSSPRLLSSWKAWLPVVGLSLWFALGVTCAVVAEGWTPLTSAYVIVQILTTVGYGDVTVTSERLKFCCAIYVFFTICLIAGFVTDRMAQIVGDDAAYFAHKIKATEMRMSNGRNTKCSYSKQWNNMLGSFVFFSIFIVMGTVFFAHYEPCSCGSGTQRVKGCGDGEQCYSTGGFTKTYVDSFYMSVITLTTVGFGDHSPKSRLGQLFGIPWMLLGVAATALFASSFGLYVHSKNKKDRNTLRLSKDIFESLDTEKDGTVSKAEFRIYALMKFGKVSSEELENIDALFATIDKDKSGTIGLDEIGGHFDRD